MTAILLALSLSTASDGFERFLKRYSPDQVVEICKADAWRLPDGTIITRDGIEDVCQRALKERRYQ